MRSLGIALLSLGTVFLSGCTTPSGAPNNTGTGALMGGVGGAGLGALLSHGHPGGALLGGALGAITGGLVGQSVDQAQAPVYVVPPPPAVMATGPRYAWANGQWIWNGYAWVWAPGHWVPVP